MKKILFAAFAALILASVNTPARERPEAIRTRDLQMNGAADNWFASVSAGVNGTVDNGTATFQGLAITAEAGKWLAPYAGLRIGWHGVNNRNLADDWLMGNKKFAYNYFHVDALFRVTNFVQYNPKRIFDLDIVAGAGAILTRYLVKNWEFAGGVGVIANFRIWKDLSAHAEGNFLFSKSGAWKTNGNVIGFPSVTAGIAYNFGRRTTWQRKETEVREVILPGAPVVIRDDAREMELQEKLDSLLNAAPGRDTVYRNTNEPISQIVYFDLDKDFLTEREEAHLEYLTWNIPAGYKADFTLYGSADKPTGNPRHNMGLSQRRCNTVRDYLARHGVQHIRCVPEGDTNNHFEGMPKNRCVIIEITLTPED